MLGDFTLDVVERGVPQRRPSGDWLKASAVTRSLQVVIDVVSELCLIAHQKPVEYRQLRTHIEGDRCRGK